MALAVAVQGWRVHEGQPSSRRQRTVVGQRPASRREKAPVRARARDVDDGPGGRWHALPTFRPRGLRPAPQCPWRLDRDGRHREFRGPTGRHDERGRRPRAVPWTYLPVEVLGGPGHATPRLITSTPTGTRQREDSRPHQAPDVGRYRLTRQERRAHHVFPHSRPRRPRAADAGLLSAPSPWLSSSSSWTSRSSESRCPRCRSTSASPPSKITICSLHVSPVASRGTASPGSTELVGPLTRDQEYPLGVRRYGSTHRRCRHDGVDCDHRVCVAVLIRTLRVRAHGTSL